MLVTAPKRWPELPDVPTVRELGMPGFPPSSWYGLVAPAGTPAAVVAKLNATVNEIVQTPASKAAFGKLGIDPFVGPPEAFGAVLIEQAKVWGHDRQGDRYSDRLVSVLILFQHDAHSWRPITVPIGLPARMSVAIASSLAAMRSAAASTRSISAAAMKITALRSAIT